MAAKKGGLGKGFNSLLYDNATESLSDEGAIRIPIGDIEPDKNQPRKAFDEESLLELEASIREHGVLQPLLVRPMIDGSYRIVAGERRYRAARRAGLTELPCIVKSLTDAEAAAISLIENLQREDLNAIEEAEGLRRLMDEFGFTQAEAAEKVSKSRSAVANTLRLLSLPEGAKEALAKGDISAGHARALLALEDEAKISAALDKILADGLSVRQTEALVKLLQKQPAAPKPVKKRENFFTEVGLSLSNVLQRKVRVVGNSKGGRVEIEYFDKEDLKRLIKAFDDEE